MATETPNPWRKSKGIKIVAAIDIMIATFSIYYNGKTLMVVFGGVDVIKEENSWVFVLIIFSLTFGFQLIQIILAVILIRSSKENPSGRRKAIRHTKIWCISSVIFEILLIIEFYIGMTHSKQNRWIILFLIFCILKLLWRIFGIYYVWAFRQDLRLEVLPEDPTVEFLKVPVQVIVTSETPTEEKLIEYSTQNQT